jgi:preprotein translocase subunit SecY
MIQTLTNAFKVPDLRKKMTYLLAVFLLYVFAAHVPVPGINHATLERLFGSGGTLFGMWDLFSGGSLRRFSILALGITPYINASIIFQLLTVVVPRLEELQKEGESGRKILSTWTRYLTIGLAFVQAFGMSMMFRGMGNILTYDTIFFRILVIMTLVGGTAFLMWLGEEISQKGIGNGVSIIIFIGIINSLPQQFGLTWKQAQMNGNWWGLAILLLMTVGTVAFIIYIHVAERKIPVQYAKRVVGRKVYGGQTTYIPLKVNTAGVIPIIFAISLLMFPATIAQFMPIVPLREFAQRFPSTVWYTIMYFLLVFVFTYFYTAVVFNPKDVADRMKKHGGFILGIRPGKPTADYLERIMVRITFMGALFLGTIAVLPSIVVSVTKLSQFSLGGTSILIVVGVALDTIRNIEAQLLMRHYEGF